MLVAMLPGSLCVQGMLHLVDSLDKETIPNAKGGVSRLSVTRPIVQSCTKACDLKLQRRINRGYRVPLLHLWHSGVLQGLQNSHCCSCSDICASDSSVVWAAATPLTGVQEILPARTGIA